MAVSIKELKKPLFLVLEKGRSLEGEALRQEVEDKYNQANLATFTSFSSASRVLYNMSQYNDFMSTHPA